jgi:DNA-binding NarL/FixJ family response regulator
VSGVRVFVVDDHSLFRSGVRAELEPAAEVVGEAGDVAAAIDGIRALAPDVVLLDVHLPGGGGRAILDAVLATHPGVRFLALSVSDDPGDVIGIVRGGARGYVVKAISGPELCQRSPASTPATPTSPRGWPGSCWTPSRATPRCRWTRSWTG